MVITVKEMQDLAESYDACKISVAVLGSHSAVELGMSAKRFGVPCYVVVQKGREALYAKYNRHLYEDVIELDNFREILNEDVQQALIENNAIFVPNRSFSVYACDSRETRYDDVENRFRVPMYGNRSILRAEDRTEGEEEKGQYRILREAGIRTPKHFPTPEDIDRLAIIKIQQKNNELERAFFFAKSAEDYETQAQKLKDLGVIDDNGLAEARKEEYVLGARFNANFHYFALTDRFGDFDFVGLSDRRQVNLQGFLNLPAKDQLKIDVPVKNEEIGHYGLTVRESKQKVFYKAAEKLFNCEFVKKNYPPGFRGLCGIQGAIAYNPEDPEGKELEFVVFDLSPRIPGDPAMGPTSPEMENLTFKHKSSGMLSSYESIKDPLDLTILEIRKAAYDKRLREIVT